jgi:NADH-quinone oxidoreductase subunit L
MAGEEGYGRFFGYMNLFVGSMLTLVLADNLLLLYLGWEGVGLCSYLLIGFWYREGANGHAARKAFIVTRIGDISLLVGIFLLATSLGSLDIQELGRKAASAWPSGSAMPTLAAALILGGALGKSAQLPLHTWLPDAMAGPSPVSALIHAATMVTAGVYLVARTNALFALAPAVQLAVAVIGAATLLVAGGSALFQTDIKRVLAYSTMSQIGYMFLALGVGAWTGAIFHLVTHAFFKALLFLTAGVIINALHHEHDIFAMGGLRRRMPFAFWVFLIGSLGLTALPPVTAGFASKDAIVARAWIAGDPGHLLWLAAMVGVLLTSTYTFRLVFLVFADRKEGTARKGQHELDKPGALLTVPLGILAFLCLVGGLLDFPRIFGGAPLFTDFLGQALPVAKEAEGGAGRDFVLAGLSLATSLLGIPLGWMAWRRGFGTGFVPAKSAFAVFFRKGWGFDRAYAFLFQAPFEWLCRVNRRDAVNIVSNGIGTANLGLSRILRTSQTGMIRWYVAFLAIGGALVVAAAVML